MKILSYLNVSNVDDIECDSGYIFNYTIASELSSRGNQAPIIATEEFDKKSIFFLLQEELDLPDYSVHNITQPMFWYNSQKANLRAYRAFPKMSNRKVDWKWVDEQ